MTATGKVKKLGMRELIARERVTIVARRLGGDPLALPQFRPTF